MKFMPVVSILTLHYSLLGELQMISKQLQKAINIPNLNIDELLLLRLTYGTIYPGKNTLLTYTNCIFSL